MNEGSVYDNISVVICDIFHNINQVGGDRKTFEVMTST